MCVGGIEFSRRVHLLFVVVVFFFGGGGRGGWLGIGIEISGDYVAEGIIS